MKQGILPRNQASRTRQRGVYVVEFAMVATVVFTMIFAALEAARLMYTYNVLTEASRRAVRLAVVCAPELGTGSPSAPAALSNFALFDGAALVPDLNPANLDIDYLDAVGANAAGFSDIRFVRATISNYQHQLMIPGLFVTLNSPAFSSVLPPESLGQTRSGTTTFCG